MTEPPAGNVSLSSGRRVAFFGGSFDPPHLGHLAVARAARDALGLHAVLFAPVGAQPLKPQGSTAQFADRLAMTRLAIAGEPGFAVSLADAPHPGGEPNYTLSTLRSLGAALPPDGSLFCLMGADSFLSLRRWRGAAEIPFAASLIVASRPGERLDDLARHLPHSLRLEPARTTKVIPGGPGSSMSDERGPKGCPEVLEADLRFDKSTSPTTPGAHEARVSVELHSYLIRNQSGELAPFYFLRDLDIEISASEIRSQVRSSDPATAATRSLLPDAVAAYISTHGLYR